MTFISNKDSTKISIISLVLFTLFGLILIFAGITDLPRYLSSSTFYFAHLIGGLIGLYAAKKLGLDTYVGKALLFLGIAQLGTFVGAVIWDYYDFIKGIEAPYPSLADAFFVLFVPFSAIGLWHLLKIYKIKFNSWIVIESIILVTIISVIIFLILGSPGIVFHANIFKIGFDLFYSISDAVLIAMAIMIVKIGSQRMFQGLAFYALGLILTAFADLTFAYRIAGETYYFGDISDFLYILSGLVLSLGIYLTAKNISDNKLPTV